MAGRGAWRTQPRWQRQQPRRLLGSIRFTLDVRPGTPEDGDHFPTLGLYSQELPSETPHIAPPTDQSTPLLLCRSEHSDFGGIFPFLRVRRGVFLGRLHSFEDSSSPPLLSRGGRRGGGAVSRVLFAVRRTVICLGRRSPGASSGLPAVQSVRAGPHRLFGLAPTGGYRAAAVTNRAVGSYPTVSPLPENSGGFFSVALSVAFRRPGVTWQSAHWSSDFPRPAITGRDRHAPPTSCPAER